MLLAPDHGLLFIHNPKAAGTSIKTALEESLGIDRNAILMAHGLAEHHTAGEARALLPADLWGRLTVFGTVREPLERLMSFWRFSRTVTAKDDHSWKGLPRERLTARAALKLGRQGRALEFEDWIRWALAWSWDPWIYTRHPGRSVILRSQIEWFDGADARLFRSDDLTGLAAWLAGCGIEVTFGRENATGGEVPRVSAWVREFVDDVYARDLRFLTGSDDGTR